jgi:GTP 3',8-cyclase
VTRRVRDALGRPLRSLRLSVTDRCNLRCGYCMPEEHYGFLPAASLLSLDELARVARAFARAGANRVRLTGGEPLLRAGLEDLVEALALQREFKELALTTNGVLLAPKAAGLKAAGLTRVTVSLDTLRPERFFALTRRDEHRQVLAGIEAAAAAGFDGPLKLDTVVMRGFNDDELVPLLDFASRYGAELRFIEYMDVGGATRWSREKVVSRAELLARLEAELGPITPLESDGSAPAERFRLSDGRTFGVIA